MKKFHFLLIAFFMLCSTLVHAQTSNVDYFAGRWNVIVTGTPGGDSKLILVLDKNDDKITGVVQDSTGKEISKLSKVELKENQITVYFTAQGYDVDLVLNKKDDNHVGGRLMNMFDADGERILVK